MKAHFFIVGPPKRAFIIYCPTLWKPDHLKSDLPKVRILNVSRFWMVEFQIPTVLVKMSNNKFHNEKLVCVVDVFNGHIICKHFLQICPRERTSFQMWVVWLHVVRKVCHETSHLRHSRKVQTVQLRVLQLQDLIQRITWPTFGNYFPLIFPEHPFLDFSLCLHFWKWGRRLLRGNDGGKHLHT